MTIELLYKILPFKFVLNPIESNDIIEMILEDNKSNITYRTIESVSEKWKKYKLSHIVNISESLFIEILKVNFKKEIRKYKINALINGTSNQKI